jgi:hypothetical protein
LNGTAIVFAPTATGSFIKYANGASEIFYGAVRNLDIVGTNGFKKTGIDLVDTSNVRIEGVHMNLTGSTANSVGIRLRGREATYITGNYIETNGSPLQISDDPNTNIDNDFTSIINNTWIGPVTGTPAANWLIDSGVNITRFTAIHNALVGGAGLQWIDTTSIQNSENMVLVQIDCEQIPSATAYCIDIEHNNFLYDLQIVSSRAPSIARGIKLRNTKQVGLTGTLYDGTGIAFDVNSSNDDVHLENVVVYANAATVTLAATRMDGCWYRVETPSKTCYSQTLTVTGGIVGTTTNDNAAAGIVGEYISSTVASGASLALTTATPLSITSISLTAGDWDVTGAVSYAPAATTSVTQLFQGSGASNTCAANPTAALGAPGTFTNWVTAANVLTATDPTWAFPTHRVSIASTTTVCLITRAYFTVDTLRAYGFISARRVR